MIAAAAVGRLAGRRLPASVIAQSLPLEVVRRTGLGASRKAVKTGFLLQPECAGVSQQLLAPTLDAARRFFVTTASTAATVEADVPADKLVSSNDGSIYGKMGGTMAYPGLRGAASESTSRLNPAHFLALLRSHGTQFFTGVPDSHLKDFCSHITDTLSRDNHIVADDASKALAHAAGHHMATGNIACVYSQNIGLASALHPFPLLGWPTSSVPALFLVGWNDQPVLQDPGMGPDCWSGLSPAPWDNMFTSERTQQTTVNHIGDGKILRGQVTPCSLREMGVPHDFLPDHCEGAFDVVEKAYKHMMETQGPFVLFVKKGTFRPIDSFMEESFMDRVQHGQTEGAFFNMLATAS